MTDVRVPVLAADDRRHLERVRRLRPGDLLSVTDGIGSWRWCRFGDDLECAGEVVAEAAPVPSIGVAFALVKGARPELVVQKLTELGVDRIVPFVAEHSVVRWDEAKGARQADRLDRIAREAAAQSRRIWWPVVESVTTFDDLVGREGVSAADRGGEAPTLERPMVMIGPEGGWSVGERARLRDVVDLGPTVLRAETAAIAAATVLGVMRAGLLIPAPDGDVG